MNLSNLFKAKKETPATMSEPMREYMEKLEEEEAARRPPTEEVNTIHSKIESYMLELVAEFEQSHEGYYLNIEAKRIVTRTFTCGPLLHACVSVEVVAN